jgi:hypothetical protein
MIKEHGDGNLQLFGTQHNNRAGDLLYDSGL